jgi:small GTP-binding protein
MGDGSVGKTSIKKRFIGLQFEGTYMATMGADFTIKEHKYTSKDGKEVLIKFMVWDLAGQTRYNAVRPHYYIGSHSALLIYDVTNYNSVDSILQWVTEFKRTVRNPVPITLIGNKIDLRDEQNVPGISYEEGLQLSKKINEMVTKIDMQSGNYNYFTVNFVETSAKTGVNIDKAFDSLSENLYQRYLSEYR